MNLRKRLLSALFGFAVLCAFSACQKSEDPISVIDITTDVTEATLPLEGGEVVVNVTSNVDWIVEMYVNNANEGEDEAWIRERVTVSPEAGTANSLNPVRITVVPNEDGYEREFVVKFRPTHADTPYAPVKIFLTASPEVRAKRRTDELIAKGQKANLPTILKEIQQRDYQDTHREVAPLKMCRDSIKLDTSNMTIEEVVAEMRRIVKEKIPV